MRHTLKKVELRCIEEIVEILLEEMHWDKTLRPSSEAIAYMGLKNPNYGQVICDGDNDRLIGLAKVNPGFVVPSIKTRSLMNERRGLKPLPKGMEIYDFPDHYIESVAYRTTHGRRQTDRNMTRTQISNVNFSTEETPKKVYLQAAE